MDYETGIAGKLLLVLGGTYASYDVLRTAKNLGLRTIVVGEQVSEDVARAADETAHISTIDHEALKALVSEKSIDGVFCGPSEFNIRNMIKLCEASGLPCYTDMETWNRCADKDSFKRFCLAHGVDTPREWQVNEETSTEELASVEYPVIVKPVDGSSSYGITVCEGPEDVRKACKLARATSPTGRIVVESYISNESVGPEIFSVRYLISDGEPIPYLMFDTYVVDTKSRNLSSALTVFPSYQADYYMRTMDTNVREMLRDMGLKNGTAFIQGLHSNGRIFLHEMGYRLSGGMIFKLTEPLMGINDMRMMVRYAVKGEGFLTEDERSRVDVGGHGKSALQLMVPLVPGKITSIRGLDEVKSNPLVTDFIQYYHTGDEVSNKVVGTLGQHFGRFTLIGEDKESLLIAAKWVDETLSIEDESSRRLNARPFDFTRAGLSPVKESSY